jgi:tetratricopeptide (TPR) repeat protein
VRAEALQQEARGHAMLHRSIDLVEQKLNQAQDLFAASDSPSDPGSHYGGPLFGVQTAICCQEAGRPEQAIELYDCHLRQPSFSPRDFGYFLTLKSRALAAVSLPDEAIAAGLQACSLATANHSARTLRELGRVVAGLRPWASRPGVRALRAAVGTA